MTTERSLPAYFERIRERIETLHAALDGAIHFEAPGPPLPKARAGHHGGRSFTTTRTRRAEETLSEYFRLAMIRRGQRDPLTGTCAVVAIFYRPDRRRIDGDNLLKLVLDAATRARVWVDDSQVVASLALVEWDPKRPRTVVALCPFASSLLRGRLPAGPLVEVPA